MDDEQWQLILPEPEYEEEETLEWLVRDFPSQLLKTLARFTRIPNSDFILPVIAAYELLPLNGLKVCSGLFCYGPSGSGKSTLGNLLQVLNPCYNGNTNPLSAIDSPNGWLQSLDRYRCISPSGGQKATPFVAIDDLTSKSLMGDNGNLRLQILKQLPNGAGCVSKGSVDGSPVEYRTFSKFAMSSVSDLPGMEGLSELNRRVILIKHKPLKEWSEDEYTEYNKSNHLEKVDDFTGWREYPETKMLWLRSAAIDIQKDRQVVKRYAKNNRDSIKIPESLLDFYNPIIAIGITANLWTIEEGYQTFEELIATSERAENDSHLKTVIGQWIKLDDGYGKFLRRYQSKGFGFDVEYSKIVKFLKEKVTTNELTMREITRPLILAAMSDLGYQVVIEGASITITMGELDNED